MLEKNKVYIAEITGLTSEGSGVCRINEVAVFVPETAIGDIAEIKIVKVLSSYAFGIVTKLLTPSSDRYERSCSVYKKCGGCVYRHINYKAECQAKEAIVKDAFERIGKLKPQFDSFLVAEETDRYRNKAQYPLAVENGIAVCGFYAPRSHRVIPIVDCPLQPKLFADISNTVLKYINDKKIPIYDENKGTGIMRHIYLRRGAHSGEVMVCLVVRKDISRQINSLCRILTRDFPDIKSIVLNINSKKTNVILGDQCLTLWGNSTITDIMCGNEIEISPLSFYQVNTSQAERLYYKALEYASPKGNETIADLYCGAGTIGLSMANSSGKIVGIEIIPEAIENAKNNAKRNNIENADFYCGDAGTVFGRIQENAYSPDIIVVDPPRKGCSKETLDNIIKACPDRIVMISCNPSTAARDSKYLCENGYSTKKVCGADLFPSTKHVECVVLMSRNES